MSPYQSLIAKLDQFIRKYYTNKLLKGLLVFCLCLLSVFIVLVVSEYYLYFPVALKLSLLVFFSLLAASAFIVWVIIPILQIRKIGKVISSEQGASIIGAHFPDVADKLLNVLQLKQIADAQQTDLIIASIEQKAAQISVVPFTKAVDFSKNKKYLYWVFIPIGLLLLLAIIAPQILKNGTFRLMNPTEHFEAPAPFKFVVQNSNLETVMYQSFTVEVRLVGDKIPEQVQIVVGGEALLMTKQANGNYTYTFNRIQQPTTFHFNAAGYSSKPYTIAIAEYPSVTAVQLSINYPPHLKMQNETRSSLSDLQLPEGTVLEWTITTNYTDELYFIWKDSIWYPASQKQNIFTYTTTIRDDGGYKMLFKNLTSKYADSLSYNIAVIKDRAPDLQITQKVDSILGQQVVLAGQVSDDHGIARLDFVYEVVNTQQQVQKTIKVDLPISNKLLSPINYYFDAGGIQLKEGEFLRYYIQACDNDAVNGGKCVTSSMFTFKQPDAKNVDSSLQKNAEQMNKSLAQTAKQSQAFEQNMQQMKEQLLQSQGMDWQQQQQMQEMLKQQEQLKKDMEAVRKRFEEQQKQSEKLELSENLQQKQEELKKQLDNLVDNELKRQLDKLQNLMQEKNKDQAVQKMQQMEQDNKLFNMNLERVQELIKKLELQLDMERVAQKLDALVEKQENLIQKTEQESNIASLEKEQKDIQNALEDIVSKDIADLSKKELEANAKDKVADDMAKLGEDASDEMEQSSKSMKENKKSNSSSSQQKAKQKMQQMSKSFQESSDGMDAEQIELDIKATRQILTNLLRYSFEQEKLIERTKMVSASSPLYVDINKEQGQLGTTSKIIKDSLFALSKRVFQIATTVNKETSELDANIKKATMALQNRQTPSALIAQQSAMTNANNLALILNELLSNLMSDQQQAQSGDKDGGDQGSKGQKGAPGQGSQGKKGQGQGQSGMGNTMKDIITKQESLGQGMQKAQGGKGQQGEGKGEGQGKGQGQGQSGEGGSSGGGSGSGQQGEYGDAKELARLAREQALLRQQLQQLATMLNSKGVKGVNKSMAELQDLMDKNETDLVNRRLSKDLLLRQQQILNKMLEAENAIRDQEEDNKRQGEKGKDIQRPIPAELKDYMKKQDQLYEQYKSTPPTLKPFYKRINEQYLNQVK